MQYVLIIVCLLLSFCAEALSLRADYPKRYIVKPGDTLWSIANCYLHRPWEWKELWYANPQIKNPDRLYAGAILELRFFKKNPYIRVLANGTIKLSPYVRPYLLGEPILPIPLADIKPFLNDSLIMDDNRLAKAPYVVAYVGERMLGGQGDEIYVRRLHRAPEACDDTTIAYAIYRPNCPYKDPKTKKILGYKANLVGYGQLVKGGEPATVLITEVIEGVRIGDRVLFNDFPAFNLNFLPKTPVYPLRGVIIDVLPEYTQGAVGLVTVINRGQDAGLEPGDVLGIYSPAHLIRDPKDCYNPLKCSKSVLLPRERLGEAMIFRVFTQTSFALVVRSIRAIRLGDIVTNP
ncbi:LysM peptidoglycan-binding domain-containing protein [Legionella sp. CNM-1927-20]|uniref:LysM peptidoglycan-binding domain-containing protein n=1 Tax=Legionella sp. CNM-1927-20 TaxID=3422221 RepID=UPI00403A9601